MVVPLDQTTLKRHLYYDPLAGDMIWLVPTTNAVHIGDIAGSVRPDGHKVISVLGRSYRSSRLIWLYVEGYIPYGFEVDHIDRNPQNDTWLNLRLLNRPCNAKNCSISHRNKSGIIGVYFYGRDKIWVSEIRHGNKNIYLGRFKSRVAAAKARYIAEIKYNYNKCRSESTAYLFLKQRGETQWLKSHGPILD